MDREPKDPPKRARKKPPSRGSVSTSTVGELIKQLQRLPGTMPVWLYKVKDGKFTANPMTSIHVQRVDDENLCMLVHDPEEI